MAKKQKGKQKQDEALVKNTQTQPATVEPVPANIPDDTHNDNGFAEGQENTWGTTEETAWGAPNAGHQGEENWLVQDTETWDTAEALLQPPTQSHNDLPTIHEQPHPGNFGRNRATLSEIEESPDEYDHSWHNSDTHSARHSESQTVTAAPPSIMGSATPPVQPSITVLQEAMKAILTQGTSTASEAARKMEKAKAVQFREPVVAAQIEKSTPQVATHGSLSASAAAAESSRKRTQATNPEQKASISKTIPWTYPKEFRPGARPPAPIPIDPSWIATGGNAWSNKHRNGFQNSSRSPGNEHLQAQHLPQPHFQKQPHFQQPHFQQQHQFQQHQFQQHQFQQQPQFQRPQSQQHTQQTQQRRQSHHAQQPQTYQRHHSHPTQPQTHHSQAIRPLYKGETKERQDWQGWGKEQWDQSTETDDESDDETATGWETSNQHEGDEWGRNGGRNGGGGWGQNVDGGGRVQNNWRGGEGQNQNIAGGWGQNTGEGRGQQAGGGWGQHAAEGWGQNAAEGWGGQGTGDTWDHNAGGWAQEPTKRKKDDRKRDHAKSHPKKGGDEWGQGGDAWGQGHEHSGQKGQKQQGNAWAQANDVWGQVGQESNQREGHDAWGQDINHRGGQDGDAWGQGVSTWGQDTGDNRKLAGEWEAGASLMAGWGDETQRLPKVTAAAPSEAVGSRNILSPQQRSQILSNLLNQTQTQNPKVAQPAVKHGAHNKTEHEQWSAWEARDHGWGSEDEDDLDDNRRVRFSPKASELWGESPRSIPAKTLAHAQQGMTTTPVNDPNNVRFLESKGAAFEYVTNAFFGNSRFARERIHWLFPSDKDPRVAAMLAWVQKLSYNLGTFGLIKFLQHRERGGLFINAIFRMRHSPKEPALDWLTFNELQGTMDKTLQESVAFYDPSNQVMVFVYLPSESGNSIAIWRLKINVPDKTRSKYHVEINAMVKTLRPHTEYVVCVDERPSKRKAVQKTTVLRKGSVKVRATKGLPTQPGEKQKWWRFLCG